ncbi:MAG TPA: prepilin-type N-terminal cleavage/methylation domain-containing protein [Gemmata sp.]|nr:prepilin-type N-terminal cleavage/methylation domain-containing protein [Gemmata sp.]
MTRTHRRGLTLMEVLVTIAILGIGILAILTLFPLSAVNMARAVRNDRSYQCARQMDGLLRAYWRAEFVEKKGAPGDPILFQALDDANSNVPLPQQHPGLAVAGAYEASYPVVVDPYGFLAPRPNATNLAASPLWIGDNPTNVPRRTMALFGGNSSYVMSALSLKDTVGYDDDLQLTPDREYRYNAMAIIQRPLNSNRYTANLTIVVFDSRPLFFAPAGVEAVFGTTFVPGTNSIALTHAAGAGPNLKPGRWVMDASVAPAGRILIRHANLYQVVSITTDTGDPSTAMTTVLELQTAIVTPTDNNTAAYQGTLVVLDGVSGVYPRQALVEGQ